MSSLILHRIAHCALPIPPWYICAIRVVVAVGLPGGRSLLVGYGLAECALAAQRSRQLRGFRKLDTFVLYLKEIGVSRI